MHLFGLARKILVNLKMAPLPEHSSLRWGLLPCELTGGDRADLRPWKDVARARARGRWRYSDGFPSAASMRLRKAT